MQQGVSLTNGIDLTILRILRYRDKFEKMYSSLPICAFDAKTDVILKDFKQYFLDFPSHDKVDPDTFDTFFAFQHPTLNPEQKGFFKTLFHRMHVDADADTEKGIITRILELEFGTKIGNILTKYNAGEDIDIQRAVEEANETLKLQLERKVRLPWVQDSIYDLLEEDSTHFGFKWRLDCLNNCMRPIKPGDFGLIAARPGAGKTTFLTDQLTHFASQLSTIYPNEERPIIWFNNEGPGKRIVTRLYQSALNASIKDLLELRSANTIVEQYEKAIGKLSNIRVMDVHDCWNYEVSDIMQECKPGLVVFDMIDNIKFGGSFGGARTDQVLEGMYQWARVLGVRFDCPVFATSQISNEGDGMQYPTIGMLKDSKTGKQGALDLQLMIGKSNDPCMKTSRFMGIPKSKLGIEGFDEDPRCEVFFDAQHGRFRMPNMENGGVV